MLGGKEVGIQRPLRQGTASQSSLTICIKASKISTNPLEGWKGLTRHMHKAAESGALGKWTVCL